MIHPDFPALTEEEIAASAQAWEAAVFNGKKANTTEMFGLITLNGAPLVTRLQAFGDFIDVQIPIYHTGNSQASLMGFIAKHYNPELPLQDQIGHWLKRRSHGNLTHIELALAALHNQTSIGVTSHDQAWELVEESGFETTLDNYNRRNWGVIDGNGHAFHMGENSSEYYLSFHHSQRAQPNESFFQNVARQNRGFEGRIGTAHTPLSGVALDAILLPGLQTYRDSQQG